MNKRPRKSAQGVRKRGSSDRPPWKKRHNVKKKERKMGRDSEEGEEKFHY